MDSDDSGDMAHEIAKDSNTDENSQPGYLSTWLDGVSLSSSDDEDSDDDILEEFNRLNCEIIQKQPNVRFLEDIRRSKALWESLVLYSSESTNSPEQNLIISKFRMVFPFNKIKNNSNELFLSIDFSNYSDYTNGEAIYGKLKTNGDGEITLSLTSELTEKKLAEFSFNFDSHGDMYFVQLSNKKEYHDLISMLRDIRPKKTDKISEDELTLFSRKIDSSSDYFSVARKIFQSDIKAKNTIELSWSDLVAISDQVEKNGYIKSTYYERFERLRLILNCLNIIGLQKSVTNPSKIIVTYKNSSGDIVEISRDGNSEFLEYNNLGGKREMICTIGDGVIAKIYGSTNKISNVYDIYNGDLIYPTETIVQAIKTAKVFNERVDASIFTLLPSLLGNSKRKNSFLEHLKKTGREMHIG